MNSVKIKLNSKGIREFLKSESMQNICKEAAEDVLSRVGGSYTIDTFVGSTRCNVSISTSDQDTYNDNLNNNTLLKAVGS